jgi:hypothetical protein
MQDFVVYINCQLSQGQYSQQCVVNIDETNIFFDMESGLTLANNKDDKTVSLKTTGTSIRCTVLLGVILNDEKLTPLVVCKGHPNWRIARTFCGMPASMKYVCQVRRRHGVDQRVFKHRIAEVWKPITVERTSTYMDEISGHLMTTCCNAIKECRSAVNYIPGGYTSKTSNDACGE